MLQVALAQVRLNARRFIAVGVAVMIAVGFLTATLVINASSKASLTESVGQSFRNADLVVSAGYDEEAESFAVLDERTADLARGMDGVADTYTVFGGSVAVRDGRGTSYAMLTNIPADESLLPVDVVKGTLPAAGRDVAIDKQTAERRGIDIGSVLPVVSSEELEGPETSLTVTAIVEASSNPSMMGNAQLYATDETAAPFANTIYGFDSIQLALADGVSVDAVQAELTEAIAGAGIRAVTVRTVAEETTELMAGFTGGQDSLTVILLAFAAVALLVCALVVSNTFSVLVAQRTRELALLRCIGAGRSQIRRSVLAEALLVGIVSSIVGVLAAVGLVAGIIAYLQTLPESGFATLDVPPLAVTAGMAAGVVLTVLAALVPARAATAVAPLAALRPAEEVRAGTRKGRVRLVSGLVLVAGGAGLLAFGAYDGDLLIALPGGILSFVGILMCSTLFIPPLVRAVGFLASPLGVPGRLAAVNAVRNPQRTSATSSALLIGVTLVVMMMTGAATARSAFNDTLAGEFPVDVTVRGSIPVESPFTGKDAAAAAAVENVDRAAFLPLAGLVGDEDETPVYSLDAADSSVLQDASMVPVDGTIMMPQGTKAETVTVRGAAGDMELDVVTSESRSFPPLVSAGTARTLGGVPEQQAPAQFQAQPLLWLAVAEGLNTSEILELQSALAEKLNIEDYQIMGSVIERAAFEQVIDVLLMVVTGLLGVAVVIALVGVANTLSLSVLERTRESSLLRALGLTKRQLRGMLALEAVLIAGVAALFGIALGAVYGWLGAQSALGSFADVVPALPWAQLAGVLAVALVAGLGASLLPARRAARLSPVAGLAAD
ncbi:FtsX-like permease family protein [Arthrobacter sp. Sa2BUA2]|uniref:FtsX-like permease family protein n=1 Tax=Arthrobacter pullicola TaxID=2762224 RepID=A0ABR8YJF0_9MICC|nr:FtsX-like permease family protein [Arthrobacter pullicola]MBD8044360.1 FtsX-like permease family protein [Arthrobacter pullicola]